MKNFIKLFFTLTLLCSFFLTGCGDDGKDPVSWYDGYKVNLTEEQGNSYTGDYFPIEEGYTCSYSGSVKMTTTVTFMGNTETEPTDAPAIGMLKVLAARNIPLPSGTISLYPVVDYSMTGGGAIYDTSRFFNSDEEAVYVKAIKLSDGSYMEVENPVFIKKNLVVGDSWETAPRMDMTKLLAAESEADGPQTDITLTAKAKFFVVGHENVSVPMGDFNAMRLEQISDINMTGKISNEGATVDMNITAQMAAVYHMVPDTGIVKQDITGPLNMTMSFSGISMTININIEKSELELTALGGDTYKNPIELPEREISAELKKILNTPEKMMMFNMSKKIAKAIKNNLSF
ncbi:MAG: hypothetical protein JXR46_17245 [Calditrichaceae bacterium]|nr:hypothetical protein [Calditrichaceae bacterium]